MQHRGAAIPPSPKGLGFLAVKRMKIKAWLNYSSAFTNGSHNAKKHKHDILRLSQLLSLDTKIPISKTISQDLHSFLLELKRNPPDLKSLGLKNQTLETIERFLETIYVASDQSTGNR